MDIDAPSLARALGGRKAGVDFWTARCPAHEDGTPSFGIRQGKDGRVLVRCYAGCAQGDVIAVLKQRGLWGAANPTPGWRPPPPRPKKEPPPPPAEHALKIWREARPARGTIVERYLATRGLCLPDGEALRFHPRLFNKYARVAAPAMVALVQHGVSGEAQAIHRTWLQRDGSGKAAFEQPRLMLGPCKQGAARLTPAGDRLLVGEGIETCLSALQATGLPTWSALSSGGIAGLELPPEVRRVIILADADDSGERAALSAATRWRNEGRDARIARPPRGMDFNDLLLAERPRPHAEEAT